MSQSYTDAYASWRRLDRARRDFRSAVERLTVEVGLIEDAQLSALAREIAENPHYRKVVKRFFGRTVRGWEVACGTDRGLWRKTRALGPERLLEVVSVARRLMRDL